MITVITGGKAYKEKRKSEQKGRLTGAAACADSIRAELKKVFPNIKFSVRSSTFSMGDSVNISWTDGATEKEVEQITGKYQYGHFNGMDDIYEYSNNVEGLPQAKYISTDRKMSEETENILKPIASELFESLKTEGNDNRPYNCYDSAQFLYQIFHACNFPTGAKPLNIIRTSVNCGINYASEFYKIEFDLSEVKEIAPKAEVKAGIVNVIEYGKGIAVIGETYQIREKLKAIGGKWNKFLTCGAGWVFTSDKLEEIKAMLFSLKEPKQQEETTTEAQPFLMIEESQVFRIDITNKTNNGDFNPSEKHIVDYLIELQGEEEQTQPEPQKEVKIVSLFDYANTQQRLSIN